MCPRLPRVAGLGQMATVPRQGAGTRTAALSVPWALGQRRASYAHLRPAVPAQGRHAVGLCVAHTLAWSSASEGTLSAPSMC